MELFKNTDNKMRDSLSVIHGVICLCLDGSLGKISDEQRDKLKMAEAEVWALYGSIGELMNIKLEKYYKKLKDEDALTGLRKPV